jgi:hypothetical protein
VDILYNIWKKKPDVSSCYSAWFSFLKWHDTGTYVTRYDSKLSTCGLFNDAVSSSDDTVPNDGMINEQWYGREM